MSTTDQNRPFVHSVFVILRHWRFIGFASLLAAAVAVVYALTMPNWYKSTASFLPPKRQVGMLEQLAGGLSSTLKTIGLGGSKKSGFYSTTSILESRRMGETIIEEFDLMNVYEIEDGSMEKTLRALAENTDFTFEEDGLVAISVWDKDAQRAADMANRFFERLNDISTRLNAAEAKANREFVRLQFMAVRDSLTVLEEKFIAFQKRTGLYSLPEQTEATLQAAGESYAELTRLKVYLHAAEQRFGSDDPDVVDLRIIVTEMEKQIPGMGGNNVLGLMGQSMKDLPDEALEYYRMYRDVETLSKLSAFLMPLYQQALLDEQKQLNVLVSLDRAGAAERKDRPKRSLIVLVAMFSVLFLSITFVLSRERFRYYKAEYPGEWDEVRKAMKFSKGTAGSTGKNQNPPSGND